MIGTHHLPERYATPTRSNEYQLGCTVFESNEHPLAESDDFIKTVEPHRTAYKEYPIVLNGNVPDGARAECRVINHSARRIRREVKEGLVIAAAWPLWPSESERY